MTSPAPVSARRATLAAHAVFVPTGIMNVLLGPLLPTLAARWTINDTQSGDLFLSQFLASTLGVLISGALVPRRGFRFAIVLGLVVMAMGLAIMPWIRWPAGLLVVASWGLGFGITIPAGNLLVASLHSEQQAASLNLLNFSWSAGAVACPFLLAPFERGHRIDSFLLLLSVCIVALALLVAIVPFPDAHAARPAGTGSRSAFRRLVLSSAAVALGLLFFLYTGVENGVGGWLASYAKRMGSDPGSLWVTAPSYFYMALLVGRATAPAVLRRMREVPFARAGLALSCLGIVFLLLATSMSGVMASAAVVGLGLAAVYPITISRMSQTAGPLAPQLGSIMFGLAGVGAASGPWLVGFTSTQAASLKLGLVVPLIGCGVMLILYLLAAGVRVESPRNTPELIH